MFGRCQTASRQCRGRTKACWRTSSTPCSAKRRPTPPPPSPSNLASLVSRIEIIYVYIKIILENIIFMQVIKKIILINLIVFSYFICSPTLPLKPSVTRELYILKYCFCASWFQSFNWYLNLTEEKYYCFCLYYYNEIRDFENINRQPCNLVFNFFFSYYTIMHGNRRSS